MSPPLLSVIIPIYNVSPYLEQFLVSLFSQSMQEDIEFIFINDCSTDDSITKFNEILKSYPQRATQVMLIQHTKNRGIAAVRQTGLLKATGKYIAFCDSDDWLDREYCLKLTNAAIEKDADIVICDYFEDVNGKLISQNLNFDILNSEVLLAAISGRRNKIWGVLWNKLIRRNIIQKYTFEENIDICEDTLMFFKVLSVKLNIVHLPEKLYYYRKERKGSVRKKLENKDLKKDFLLFETISNLKKLNKEDPEYVLSCESFIQEQIISRAFRFSSVSDSQYRKLYNPYFSNGIICQSFPKFLNPLIYLSNYGYHTLAKKLFWKIYSFLNKS